MIAIISGRDFRSFVFRAEERESNHTKLMIIARIDQTRDDDYALTHHHQEAGEITIIIDESFKIDFFMSWRKKGKRLVEATSKAARDRAPKNRTKWDGT
jgi:hypothetical protein